MQVDVLKGFPPFPVHLRMRPVSRGYSRTQPWRACGRRAVWGGTKAAGRALTHRGQREARPRLPWTPESRIPLQGPLVQPGSEVRLWGASDEAEVWRRLGAFVSFPWSQLRIHTSDPWVRCSVLLPGHGGQACRVEVASGWLTARAGEEPPPRRPPAGRHCLLSPQRPRVGAPGPG